MRRACLLLVLLLGISFLTGCFDYRGVSEQTMVSGIAVDADEAGISLTLELVDIQNAEDGRFGSIVLTTTGATFAEALHEATVKLHGEVYLGTLQVVILSQEIGSAGILPVVEYLIRDKQVRNSLPLVIAGADTAAALLTPAEEAEQPRILSEKLSESLRRRDTTQKAPALHEIYDRLQRDTSGLALPIVALSESPDIPFQLDGLALFSRDRQIGTLPESDMPIYLLMTSALRDRAISVEVSGERVVLLARSARPRRPTDRRVTAEVMGMSEFTPERRAQIEEEASGYLTRQVQALYVRLQGEGFLVGRFAETTVQVEICDQGRG